MKEIVIKIPDEAKEAFDNAENNELKGGFYDLGGVIASAIRNGKVLPKGHGELITKGQAVALVQFYQQNPQHFSFENLIDDIDKEVPVIEGDTE